MTRDEAKIIFLRYRPGTTDEEDPHVREALVLAKEDLELSSWLEKQTARQQALRKTFRRIKAPDGLMEQIISEQVASERRMNSHRRLAGIAVAAGILMVTVILGFLWHRSRPHASNTLDMFERQMASYALRGYTMDLQTNDAEAVREFFRKQQAPWDYAISSTLQKAALIGCSVENWQTTKVSMICFASGAKVAPVAQNDLWLFVVDPKSVEDPPRNTQPQVFRLNRLTAATWLENGKLYLLATTADESVFRGFF
jgi:hypothetical protein